MFEVKNVIQNIALVWVSIEITEDPMTNVYYNVLDSELV